MPEKVKMIGHRTIVVSNDPELTEKLQPERSKIFKFLLDGALYFQKQNSGPDIDAK